MPADKEGLPLCHCRKCGKTWVPRVARPVQCPACHTIHWQEEKNMENHAKEEAVSPVIGVILMVAITVILAAVLAAFVLGMANQVESPKNIAVTATQTGDDITVIFQGGDTWSLESFRWSVDGVNMTEDYPLDIVIGSTATAEGVGDPEPDNVIVVASFTDGKEQVVCNAFV